MRISLLNLRKFFKHAMLEKAGNMTGNLTTTRVRAAIVPVEK